MVSGVDFVDASFAAHATSAGHAMLLDPAEWRLHDAEVSEMPEGAPPSAMQQEAPDRPEDSQHAHRLHGKQRNPRNKAEVTVKAVHDSKEMPLPATSMSAIDRQQQLFAGQDIGPVHPLDPVTHDSVHMPSTGATGRLQASGKAAVHLGDSVMGRDAAEVASWETLEVALQAPVSVSRSEGMQNKRGLAEQAPSHVKHPRHRADSDPGHVDAQPASLQDACAATGRAGNATGRWGRKGQTDHSAPGTDPSPRKPELPSSQHALPSTIVLDVWKVHYRADSRPLGTLCACSTCQRHSRAYIHHLLKTKEMLAQVLLPITPRHDSIGVLEQDGQIA